jgi:hypothetical protein
MVGFPKSRSSDYGSPLGNSPRRDSWASEGARTSFSASLREIENDRAKGLRVGDWKWTRLGRNEALVATDGGGQNA